MNRFVAITMFLMLPISTQAVSAQKEKELQSKPMPVPKRGTGWSHYWGTVTELSKNTITVQYSNDTQERFTVSTVLAAGGYSKNSRLLPGDVLPRMVAPSSMYRFTDVKIGDWVTIEYTVIDGVVTCDHICIHKRPGGRMPALPKEAEDLRMPTQFAQDVRSSPHIPYHEYWDAYWDLEDRGIPYPEKFGKKRRFPVAPEPRAAKVRSAINP